MHATVHGQLHVVRWLLAQEANNVIFLFFAGEISSRDFKGVQTIFLTPSKIFPMEFLL